MSNQEKLLSIYSTLKNDFGYKNWWPAENSFEIIIGAILAQGVSWNNVEKSIENLKSSDNLDPEKLMTINISILAQLIKPSRFYNQKAKRIKNFLDFLYMHYDNNPINMVWDDPKYLKQKFLEIYGIGEETADSILLYALGKPVFVIDSYTKRIFIRYGFINNSMSYNQIQSFFMSNLPMNVILFNDYHAQIVNLGNLICQKKPKCDLCPIRCVNHELKCKYSLNIK